MFYAKDYPWICGHSFRANSCAYICVVNYWFFFMRSYSVRTDEIRKCASNGHSPWGHRGEDLWMTVRRKYGNMMTRTWLDYIHTTHIQTTVNTVVLKNIFLNGKSQSKYLFKRSTYSESLQFWIQPFGTLDHKTSLQSHRYMCSNSQQYISMGHIYQFFFYAKNQDIRKIFWKCSYCKYIKM